ncbi:MAG TPA: glycosyltransferase family 1 protein [Gemmatimonadaceae bacterium]|nr:glycosyltransferase family 1 protein [Gemmatimonadaceae bacterium]
MLVAIEATRLLREVRGIGRYVRALLPRLVASDSDMRLVLFVKRERDVTALSAIVARDPGLAARVDVRRVRGLPRFTADVFWYPWNVVRPEPRHGAVVVTMHDVAPLVLPDPRWYAWRKNARWRRRFATTARSATLIVADSAFTAAEVQRVLHIAPERIRVVLLAADDFAAGGPSEGDAAALARLGVELPFVLTVGAADRRKNHAQLERAMEHVVLAHPHATLVQAGPRRDEKQVAPDARWQRTLGFVSDHDLVSLYRSAAALVMVSTYEGFGLPVLEAMQVGTPVICARASSLPEVAADAAIWVEPGDEMMLANAIASVLHDQELRARMVSAGLSQSAKFKWDETARQTVAAFHEARQMYAGSRPSTTPVVAGSTAGLGAG